jgi:integrase
MKTVKSNEGRIDTRKGRSLLVPRREPYWRKLGAGFFLGYRRLDVGGSWIARCRDPELLKQVYQSLGEFPESEETDPLAAATQAAQKWLREYRAGVRDGDSTVSDACAAYTENLRLAGKLATATDADGRFRRLVYGKAFGRIKLAVLSTRQTRAWLAAMLADVDMSDPEQARRARASANRNLATLKAALNFAHTERLVATDDGWKTVTPFEGVGTRRGIGGDSHAYLNEEQRKLIFENSPDDVRLLLQALLLTAARPGEIAGCSVSDFGRKHGTLRIRDGKTGERVVTLSTAAVEFFKECAKGRIGSAPLLMRTNGTAWTKDAWKKPVRKAIAAAGLPEDVVLYSLRHAAISEMIASGMPVAVVAMLAGTSVAMIEAHYGHLKHSETRKQLDAVKLAM